MTAPKQSINKFEIGEGIVKSFHEQFAQNQNHHQSLFLQVLTVLLSVLIGFGYLYIRVGVTPDKAEVNVNIETIYAFLSLACFLLSLSIAIISNMALGFRRDQVVACNIRVLTGVMPKADEKNNGYFIKEFNPVGKTKTIFWMPEFHIIFFVTLLSIKALLLIGVVFNSSFHVVFSSSPNILITISIVLSLFSFIVDLLVSKYYLKKWKKHSDEAPEILRSQE